MEQILTEETALALMRRCDGRGLEWFIRQYTPYVSAIVWNILGRDMTAQDAEEVVADVFVTLWQYCQQPEPGKVRPYLASIARSRAINKLRSSGRELELEYDKIELPTAGPEQLLLEREQRLALRRALEDMAPIDREIFIRHYYYCQSSREIAGDMDMTAAAVRQRLKRGRDGLRLYFEKGARDYAN
ncbi:MAG: sigma-70 family RNA polymerase sigma factor [Oscillospiraceae bacterium]|nr:sigma-70 family RNA polymerase sigma factor [Oscillospiraceae bacterium]